MSGVPYTEKQDALAIGSCYLANCVTACWNARQRFYLRRAKRGGAAGGENDGITGLWIQERDTVGDDGDFPSVHGKN